MVLAASAGCSLGIDKSLIGESTGGDDGGPVEAGNDGSVHEGGDGKAPPTDGAQQVQAVGCTTDSDCNVEAEAGAGCVTAAKCDPTWHVCLLTTCSVGACKAAVCNTSLNTCSVPTTYGFEATQFSVQQGGVGAGVRNSIAAIWPFVFVITTNGVVGFNVVDPTNTQPPVVPVNNVPFIPIAAVAVGRRVYFVNGTTGNGPTYREAIAWVDVPQDPLVTELQASTAFVGTSQQGVAAVYTNGLDGMFLVYGSGNEYPSVNLHPPLGDTTTLSTFSNAGLPNGAVIAASSGSRLVSWRYDGAAQLQNFALVNGAGTAGAQTSTEQAVSAFGQVSSQAELATGDDGTMLWNVGVEVVDDAGSDQGVGTARLTWLLQSGTAANFDTTLHADLETYSPPTSAFVTGPPVWIDANTALGIAAASSTSTNSSSVQAVTKSPPAVQTATRTLISVPPSSVGAAQSNGFGYLLAQDDPKNQSCSVYIFAPSCGSGDP